MAKSEKAENWNRAISGHDRFCTVCGEEYGGTHKCPALKPVPVFPGLKRRSPQPMLAQFSTTELLEELLRREKEQTK